MRCRRMLAVIGVAASLRAARSAAATLPDLGAASSFAVLAKDVQSSGPTVITGNAGGDRVNGFPPGVVQLGTVMTRGLGEAERDVAAAMTAMQSLPSVPSYDLEGTILLDAEGNADKVWIFRTTGRLTTAPGTSVLVIGGGRHDHVLWLAEGGATFGEGTSFIGTVLTSGAVTLNGGVTITGRLLSLGGTVTLKGSRVSLCCDPITPLPASLPDGRVGTLYSQPLSATGGLPPYTFRRSSGTLPPGLTPGMTLSGVPSESGHYEFTLTATDAHGCFGTAAYEVDIAPCTLELGPIADGPLPRNGTPPYRCELTGVLPDGMSLQDCAITGSAKPGACSSVVTVKATDANGCTGSRTYTICVPLTFSPATLPAACVGTSYQPLVTASCGAVVIANAVTPPQAGPFGYTVIAQDPISACGTSTQTYVVEAAGPAGPALPATLPNGTVCTPYDPGLPPNAIVKGAPPPIPTKAGPYPVTVTIPGSCPATRQYNVTVDCPSVSFTPLPANLPPATVGEPYDIPFSATGGTCAYTLTSTALPPGFPDLLSGKPTTADVYKFTVTATYPDSGCTATADYVLTVNPAPVVTPGAAIPTLSPAAMAVLIGLLAVAALLRKGLS